MNPDSDLLSIHEKREWLALVFRGEADEDGSPVSLANKFKALAEDTKLALLENKQAESAPPEPDDDPDALLNRQRGWLRELLDSIPPPALPPGRVLTNANE